MKDQIKEIGIDKDNRLYIKPASAAFPMIYREANEVNWDKTTRALYGGIPRKWNHTEWFNHIIKCASAQGFRLEISPQTEWINISAEIQSKIINESF